MIPQITSYQKRLPPPFGRLSAEARLLIALRKSKAASREDICMILNLKPIEAREFWAKLKENDNAKQVIENGLPAMFGEALPDGVRLLCPYCRRWVTWLPCVTCCEHDIGSWHDLGDIPLAETREPTSEKPGTIGKIEVMAKRVSAGLEPFCKDDAVIWD